MKVAKLPDLNKDRQAKHVNWMKMYMKSYFSTIIYFSTVNLKREKRLCEIFEWMEDNIGNWGKIEKRSKLMKKETEDFSKIKAKKNILKTKRFEQKIKS